MRTQKSVCSEIQRYFEEKLGVVISMPTICRATHRLGLTRRVRHLILSRYDAERAAYSVQIKDICAPYFVWLDETGVYHRDGLRRMGYSIKGHAHVSQKLMGWGKRFSALALMSVNVTEDVALLEGGVDGINFYEYLESSVLPNVMPFNLRSTLTVDRAFIHHIDQVQDRYCWLLFVVLTSL